jgi:hypothetical protein
MHSRPRPPPPRIPRPISHVLSPRRRKSSSPRHRSATRPPHRATGPPCRVPLSCNHVASLYVLVALRGYAPLSFCQQCVAAPCASPPPSTVPSPPKSLAAVSCPPLLLLSLSSLSPTACTTSLSPATRVPVRSRKPGWLRVWRRSIPGGRYGAGGGGG